MKAISVETFKQETTITRVTVATDCCKHCGDPYAACKYPVSHAHPSIDAINIPAEVNAIAARYVNGETTKSLTSYEREVWDRTAILGNANF